MRSLLEGVKRYETTKRARYSSRFAKLASGQEPLALFITCSDSRVVPSLIALSDPGELFVVRNVANLVPPHVAGVECPDTSVSSAVWYALEVLEIRDVVVCGHSGCGGIKALRAGAPPAPLERWLAHGERSLEAWRAKGPLDASLTDDDQLSQVSALQQLANLETHDHVRARVESGVVRLHAWWFDIPSARLLAYSRAANRYVPILEAEEPASRPRDNVISAAE
ncbi:MAG: carbonic anhydrase [Labilithrix sp.]|nr:carbonic anhydrase [Labilithrix sp.]